MEDVGYIEHLGIKSNIKTNYRFLINIINFYFKLFVVNLILKILLSFYIKLNYPNDRKFPAIEIKNVFLYSFSYSTVKMAFIFIFYIFQQMDF